MRENGKDMPPGGELGGPMAANDECDMGENGGASYADCARGYSKVSDPDLPSQTVTMGGVTVDNYDRMAWDPEKKRMVDRFGGGFIERTPWNPNDR